MSRCISGAAIAEPVIVLRPEPGLGTTLAAARALGLEAVAAPLFAVEPISWEAPAAEGFDALLVGSANVFRHGGPGLARLRALSVIAVGKATAAAARAHGFTVSHIGESGLQKVLDGMAGTRQRQLRLAGEAHIPLAPPEGVTITEVIVYRTRPLALDDAVAARLAQGGIALLHSGEAAARFADECDRLGLTRRRIAIAALAPRIAASAGGGWREVRIARGMSDGDLLELAREMCQKP